MDSIKEADVGTPHDSRDDGSPRILHLSTFDTQDGAARGSIWLTKALQLRGIESSLVVSRKRSDDSQPQPGGTDSPSERGHSGEHVSSIQQRCNLITLRGTMAERASIIAIPWYRRRDYAALSKLFSDPQNLPKTFGEWLELALLAERRFQRDGLAVARILIRPVPFAAWCKERNLIPDQRTRLTFANEAARHLVARTEEATRRVIKGRGPA